MKSYKTLLKSTDFYKLIRGRPYDKNNKGNVNT